MSNWNPFKNMIISKLPEEYRDLYSKYGLDNPETADAGFIALQRAAIVSNLPIETIFLGELYHNDKGYWDALFLYRQHQDHPLALRNIGILYREGGGVEKDVKKALSYFEKAAELGDMFAICELGYCHLHGLGVDKDPVKAVSLFRQASDAGYLQARYNLATVLLNGADGSVEKDQDQACALMLDAANQGHSTSQLWVGQFYCYGIEGNRKGTDREKALTYLQLAVEQENSRAMYHLAGMYLKRNLQEHERDPEKGMEFLEMAAERGEVDAQVWLGEQYLSGKVVQKDFEKAAKWFNKAADKDDEVALYHLGVMYEKGEGMEVDLDKAAKFYLDAAELGHARASYIIGVMLYYGRGVERDLARAIQFFEKAANQEHSDALTDLGLLYHEGDGVGRDVRRAVGFYQRAVAQGNAKAQCNLGVIFLHGDDGIPPDQPKAVELFTLAANQRQPLAFFNLGICHWHGMGVPGNMRMAIEYFHVAALNKYDLGKASMVQIYELGEGLAVDMAKAAAWKKV